MLPFTQGDFLGVFARYHRAVGALPWIWHGAALASLLLLRRPSAHQGRGLTLFLAALWTWMALAYHAAFFSAINPAAWAFALLFLAEAGALLCAAKEGTLVFALRRDGSSAIGGALLAYALLGYPLLGLALGQRPPFLPTFGLPCPTTIYTLGLLCLARPTPRGLFIVPLLWSAIGAVAAFRLGVPEDYGLLIAGALALPIALKKGA